MLFLIVLAILAVWIVGKFFTAVAAAIIIAGIVLALVIKGMSSPEFRGGVKEFLANVRTNPQAIKWLVIFAAFIAIMLLSPYIYNLFA